ncbi:MAG: FemAB family PEP-CTERM system-associated protein [Planctomycetes bacterium]|nr:FemAB family PEP-CTERM system-associated protein [Planctomycetota bacterium]
MTRQDAPEVKRADERDAGPWDAYAAGHPAGTVFHKLAWSRAVQAAYGHEPLHLLARSEGHICGVLPLFLVKSLLAGRLLVSVPYATYGGILADSHEAAAALLASARDLCRQFRARYLELRHREPSGLDLPEMDRYDTFRKSLPERAEDVMATLPRKTRAAARNGLKRLGDDCTAVGREWLDTVYDLYSVTLRRLGSPNYSRGLFHALLREYGDDCVPLVVRDGGRPIAGVVSFVFRDEIVPYFSGSLDVGMEKDANNVMYVRLMEYAVGRGLRRFDFNRTRRDNRGPYDFKRHHGFEPTPLHYQFYLSGGGELPNFTPSNEKYALAGRLWRRLPLWLTRTAGARITKWVP